MAIVTDDIKLEARLVGSIHGNFIIPSYQRGYRWGKEEVERLLDDIYANGTNNYCLQPVVVKRNGNKYELIDGQQRLTTLFLVYQYMNIASCGFLDEPKFSLEYETRNKSKDFLQSIDTSRKEENVDFWFICNAYESIEEWFSKKDKKSSLTNINKFFDENVKIIWYEVNESEDAIKLFARLNIGKIPLTSAELVKAMFLSNGSAADMSREKQEEISLQWDNIEKELHNDSLWYFLTNRSDIEYQTRIDLVLDLISRKPSNSKDKYYTFFYFDKPDQKEQLKKTWQAIQHTFLILKDWYENHELYHKIGYLIASESKSLQQIYEMSQNKTKKLFKQELNACIKESIAIPNNYADLSYDKAADYEKISRLLLLFNIESVRTIDEQAQRFPFDNFKYQKNGEICWSLEHIHAQQSDGMKKQEHWKEWLKLHIPSIRSLDGDNTSLLAEMESAYESQTLERYTFEEVQHKVIQRLSLQSSIDYLHSISNIALLNTRTNTALNNSTFDVKRNVIIDMDKHGQYIPFCTKMVFLKYYTPSDCNQLHFWGASDRKAYVNSINYVLADYLTEPISIESEEK